MDAEAFRIARRDLGLTQVAFGEAFGVSRRTVQNWTRKGPPTYIAELLQLALVNRIAGPKPTRGHETEPVGAFPNIAPALDTLLRASIQVGWEKEAMIAAVEVWVIAQKRRGVNHKE